jgi:hypothetical protein
MEANRFTNCAHSSCRCTVETEERFCRAVVLTRGMLRKRTLMGPTRGPES